MCAVPRLLSRPAKSQTVHVASAFFVPRGIVLFQRNTRMLSSQRLASLQVRIDDPFAAYVPSLVNENRLLVSVRRETLPQRIFGIALFENVP